MKRIVLFILLLSVFRINIQASCIPSYDVPPLRDCPDSCSACSYADSFFANPCTLYKFTEWSVHWPDGINTTFMVSSQGQRLWQKDSCCGNWVPIDEYPLFGGPEVGDGYIRQGTQRAYMITGTHSCGFPCSNYTEWRGVS